jgi:TFIIF-interacting CTD phosphatase-like protein
MITKKDLRRIFPTDDRMVVVIDDRSDVWPNCPNLVQVSPYNFFLGIGDINNQNQNLLQETHSRPCQVVLNDLDRELEAIEGVIQSIITT